MQRTRLLFGLAAVFAGIATVEFVLGFVYSPVLFGVAVPFAVAGYLLWYHASGRLAEQVRSGRADSYGPTGTDRAGTDSGGFGAGPRESYSGRRGGFDAGPRDGFRAGANRGRGGSRNRTVGVDSGPTAADAYRTLGLDSDADAEEVRRAYREKVKSVHPDREGGDEEEFKRVTEAYERLRER